MILFSVDHDGRLSGHHRFHARSTSVSSKFVPHLHHVDDFSTICSDRHVELQDIGFSLHGNWDRTGAGVELLPL